MHLLININDRSVLTTYNLIINKTEQYDQLKIYSNKDKAFNKHKHNLVKNVR